MRWHLNFVRRPYRLHSNLAPRCTTTTLLREELLLIELKTAKAPDDAHQMQCINDLKATGLGLCLLLNFRRPRMEIKRVAHGQCTARTHLRESAYITFLYLR